MNAGDKKKPRGPRRRRQTGAAESPGRDGKKIRESHFRKQLEAAKVFTHGRLLLIILLLLVQFAGMTLFFVRFESHIEFFFGGSILISVLFITYLTNCRGKNEFKIAWILPTLVIPVFGLLLYFFYKTDSFSRRFKRRLADIKRESGSLLAGLPETRRAHSLYPKIQDIAVYLSREGNYPAYTDTAAKYFPSGESVFPDMLEEMKKAERFIFIEYFIIEPSRMWFTMLEILKEKAAEGVDVRVLYDSLGSITFATRRTEKILAEIGVKAKIFQPFIPVFDTSLNNRDHRKILDIDGRVVYTGGINISDEYINEDHSRFDYWKDVAIRLKGPAVRTFTVMFLQQWNLANRTAGGYEKFVSPPCPAEPPQGAVIPYGDDAFNNADIAENVYNYVLSRAHGYVHIMSPYIIIDNTLLNAMIFAAKRGVDVTLLVPARYDHLLTFCVGRTFVRNLIENGIRVFAYRPGFLHAKVFVSDGNRAVVGSVNLDYRSLYHHFECGVYLYNSPEIPNIERDFQETKRQCDEITADEYRRTPLLWRILGRLFRIFAPLL